MLTFFVKLSQVLRNELKKMLNNVWIKLDMTLKCKTKIEYICKKSDFFFLSSNFLML